MLTQTAIRQYSLQNHRILITFHLPARVDKLNPEPEALAEVRGSVEAVGVGPIADLRLQLQVLFSTITAEETNKGEQDFELRHKWCILANVSVN